MCFCEGHPEESTRSLHSEKPGSASSDDGSSRLPYISFSLNDNILRHLLSLQGSVRLD